MENQPGDHRVHAGPKVAQPLGSGSHGERSGAELLGEYDPVRLVCSVSVGNRPDLSQSNVPPSTRSPAMTAPWPASHLVAEWTIRSAP